LMAILYGINMIVVIYQFWTGQNFITLLWFSLVFPLYYIFLAFFLRTRKTLV
jgi:hypothetical protein